MGHPKLRKKTYKKPTHPWQKDRIEEEKILLKEFGLKNKKEIWRVNSLLRKYAKQAKNLTALDTPQAKTEKAQLLKKLSHLGLIKETSKLEDALSLTLRSILNRRLQTLVYKNNLAKSIRQARQFIIHGHIMVGNKKITIPSYLVSEQEQTLINFAPSSKLSNQDHPERLAEKESATNVPKEEKKKLSNVPEEHKKSEAFFREKGLEKAKTSQKESKEKKPKKEPKEKKKQREEPGKPKNKKIKN